MVWHGSRSRNEIKGAILSLGMTSKYEAVKSPFERFSLINERMQEAFHIFEKGNCGRRTNDQESRNTLLWYRGQLPRRPSLPEAMNSCKLNPCTRCIQDCIQRNKLRNQVQTAIDEAWPNFNFDKTICQGSGKCIDFGLFERVGTSCNADRTGATCTICTHSIGPFPIFKPAEIMVIISISTFSSLVREKMRCSVNERLI